MDTPVLSGSFLPRARDGGNPLDVGGVSKLRRSERTQKVGSVSDNNGGSAGSSGVISRRLVQDRWYYIPSDSTDGTSALPVGEAQRQEERVSSPPTSGAGDLSAPERNGEFLARPPPTPDDNDDLSGRSTSMRSRSRIGLTLTFPDGERNDQRYSAHPGWTVLHFRERMGRLLFTVSPVKLTVGPHWGVLDRLGSIGDRTLPGSTLVGLYFPRAQFGGSRDPVSSMVRWFNHRRKAFEHFSHFSRWRVSRSTVLNPSAHRNSPV